jgi:hypothetical protein
MPSSSAPSGCRTTGSAVPTTAPDVFQQVQVAESVETLGRHAVQRRGAEDQQQHMVGPHRGRAVAHGRGERGVQALAFAAFWPEPFLAHSFPEMLGDGLHLAAGAAARNQKVIGDGGQLADLT